MTTALPHTEETTTQADPGDRCPACPHPRSEHDALGTRFCTATVTTSMSRGCICR